MPGHRLLIVEDDAAQARMLADDLAALDHDMTVAGDGREALTLLDREPFDAVILDRMLPSIEGVALVERMRADGKLVPVLMLTALGRAAEKVEGLAAGADDYVVKPASAAEIDARIRALLRARGWTAGAGDTLRAGDITVSPAQFRAWRGGRDLGLARLELQLLAELARHAGTVVTRAMLLERVWGYDFEPATNIVDVQVRGLRRKLTAAGERDPIATMRGAGYMLKP